MDRSDLYNDFELGDGEYLNSYEDSTTDLKFRSIRVDEHPQHDFFPAAQQFSSQSTMPFGAHSKYVNLGPVKQPYDFVCPSMPLGISNNKFNINIQDYATVVRSISEYLKKYNENFDFSFIQQEQMWKGKFLYGSNCFEVEVNLYQAANGYTVAARKVKCDCAPNSTFSTFFNSMKAAMCTDANVAPARKAFTIPSMAGMLPPVSSEEFLEGIRPIFSMAKGCWESRVQAAKMLCDVSRKEARYLELPQFKTDCLRTLENFVSDECEDVRQYAVMAIAAFAELPSYQECFVRSRVLSVIFALVDNPCHQEISFETAQIRRTAAAVLAHLSKSHAYAVRATLHQQQCDVLRWMGRASEIHDDRAREAALVAKACLEEVSCDNIPVLSSEEFAAGISSLVDEETAIYEMIR